MHPPERTRLAPRMRRTWMPAWWRMRLFRQTRPNHPTLRNHRMQQKHRTLQNHPTLQSPLMLPNRRMRLIHPTPQSRPMRARFQTQAHRVMLVR